MADKKKSVNLLPEYFQTAKNSKFLSSTIDQFTKTPKLDRIDGYIGSILTPTYKPGIDNYLNQPSELRNKYPLEPALVFKDAYSSITDVIGYDDIINEIGIQGGINNNLDRLFRSNFYSYDPLIDWDKLVNYPNYFWLPNGPKSILINKNNVNVDTSITGREAYTLPYKNSKTGEDYTLSNGMMITFLDNVLPEYYRGKTFVVEGVGSSIKLIDFSILEPSETLSGISDERFDAFNFDEYPFDGSIKVPVTPAYITINKASKDLNPWTRYNRWFHSSIIEISADINGDAEPVFPLNSRAQRPIIEFKPNIQLYNFGENGIQNIDVIDNDTRDAYDTVDGTYGYYIDGVLLEKGTRIVFNADTDKVVRNTIFEIDYDYDAPGSSPIIRLIVADTANNLDAVSVNYGNEYSGTNWYYDAINDKWVRSQEYNSLNQAPLFDLFDQDGISYSRGGGINTFVGNKIFGYDIGFGVSDSILGFSIRQQNSVGAGSYLFKNYFMSDVITVTTDNLSSEVSTSLTLLKINSDFGDEPIFTNVWKTTETYQIPIVEIQTVTEETNSLILTCLDYPFDSNISLTAYVNGSKVNSSVSASTHIDVLFDQVLKINDVVTLKILTEQTPNSNGYYETPLSLTNNPLNGPISNMTLSELSDHVSSMVNRDPAFDGVFPGNSNLRDLANVSRYGTRLIINSNPISFANIFFGKKEHNVVDALRVAADQYNQFKMNLLKAVVSVSDQLTAADALDEVLQFINISKDIKTPYYYSDMLGYGKDKIVRNFTVSSNVLTYPIGAEFSLTKLSAVSVLVYLNDHQLVVGKDYTIDPIDEVIELTRPANNGDTVSIRRYLDTNGSFIPATPSKLGLYLKYEPEIYTDNSYSVGPVSFIRGHDGSLVRAYGDYRDQILLEFERRIYNNIKVSYNSKVFDVVSVMPGAFRSKYSRKDLTSIITQDFLKWAGAYNIDVYSNTAFDEGDPLTWNFKGGYDSLLEESTFGSWRALYTYFFDTDRPHTHPWEMLGIEKKPSWWDDEYGSAPYLPSNTKMWGDLQVGDVRGTGETLPHYARPGLLSILPVDEFGNLKSPDKFLVGPISYSDKSAAWAVGDFGPAETSWRKSSYWPFVANIAAALLDPCSYASKNYDLSRISINELGQVTYGGNIYLNPANLVIPKNETYSAGFGVYLQEIGNQNNLNYSEALQQDLDYLNFNLFHKLGGFASKEKLQVLIDSVDPVSKGIGVVLPLEDYSLILNTSNPIKSASISGIIIQKSNGNFIVKGYDKSRPYFEILSPVKTAVSGTVTVGGSSSTFTEWASVTNNGNSGLSAIELTSSNSVTTRSYKQGQIVRYNNRFYVVKIDHIAQTVFDPALFQLLPSLPIVGGSTAQLPAGFSASVTQVPYGSEFSAIQDVYDLIVGYGAYLESQGFVFDYFNTDLDEILDWKFTGKEFLYWTTQNWGDNNLITLSPFANLLKYSFPDSIVDNITSGKYEYSLLNADGKSFPINQFTLSREDGVCTIATENTEEGLFFARLNSVQKEHGIVFNNTTIFNDTVYDIETGYRQLRMRLSGFRTKDWNGDLSSPGFVYDSVEITDWERYKNYQIGQVVRYNGSYYSANEKIRADAVFEFSKWVKLSNRPVSSLLPNFDYKINQFEDFYSLDIDNFDSAQQQLSQHLIGYTPRTYLNNIFSNNISQYKFYQGFIKEKGTKNAISKIAKASVYNLQGSIDFKEEWAFRVGDYGSFGTYNEIEFVLEEGSSLENPYIVKFVNQIPPNANELVNYIRPNELLVTPDRYQPDRTFNVLSSTYDDDNLELISAGYVRLDDVTATAYNKNSLLDIANNSALMEGNTIWAGFLENGSWAVYRYSNQPARVSGVYVSSPATEITFVTTSPHGLNVGDIVSVVRFNEQVDGVYIVKSIPVRNQFTVASELSSITDDDLPATGSLFKFDNVRYSTTKELANNTNLFNFSNGSKVWIDSGEDQTWVVYEKVDNYTNGTAYEIADIAGVGNKFGYEVYATDDSSIVVASAIDWKSSAAPSLGRVVVYDTVLNRLDKIFEHTLNDKLDEYCDSIKPTEFGYALAYDVNKDLYFAGAPRASNVRKVQVGNVYLSTSTASSSTVVNEGLVKISTKLAEYGKGVTSAVLANSNVNAAEARFGHSIYINQVPANEPSLLLVGAPGGSSGSVFAYQIALSNTGKPDISAHPSGLRLQSTLSGTTSRQFGSLISGSKTGDVIAVASYGYTQEGNFGAIEIFNKSLSHVQTILSPFAERIRFGDAIAVSSSGKYLIVSAIDAPASSISFGQVAVFVRNSLTNRYELFQTLSNPASVFDIKFGYAVSISADEITLIVSALGTNNSNRTTFDNDTTLYDGGTTRFVQPISDAGTAYIYNNLGGYFVQAGEVIDPRDIIGSRFGNSVVATNNSVFVGAPSYLTALETDESAFYVYQKIDNDAKNWKVVRQQSASVDISEIKRVSLIDSQTEEIIEYLDIIDPLKGKIAGIADQELKYKSVFDPAVYSIGLSNSIVDTETSWIDDHVGELWWDLSTAKYVWYDQGDDIFKKNNWGQLFPGASIDVYEWVKSDLLPSEWSAQADTNEGLTFGVSGQPKYPDNSIVSVKQTFNTVTGSFENVYYFWVKNKVTIPSAVNRRISSFQVANLIADPAANGLSFVEILSADSIAFANVQPKLVGSRISANIVVDTNKLDIPRHTEWMLMEEGNKLSMPSALLDKKLFDSLLGRDDDGNPVPSLTSSPKNRFGLGIRPQQSLFKNRLSALRNVVEFANSVLEKNRIADVYSLSNFQKQEEIPDETLGEYDYIIEDIEILSDIDTSTYITAELECFTTNGKITSVTVVNPGFGYTTAPSVTVLSNTGAGGRIVTEIDENGRVVSSRVFDQGNNYAEEQLSVTVRPHTVIVRSNKDYGGRWSSHIFDTLSNSWIRNKTQSYNTSLYWSYIDWNSDDFNFYKDYKYVVSDISKLSDLVDISTTDYIKVNNRGNGKFAILQKSNNTFGNFVDSFDIVFSQQGSIRISDSIWDLSKGIYSYDSSTLEETLYDQIPDLELYYILTGLKNDIFADDLKVNWNNLFFKAVRYAFTEQKLLDWAFKTSFINVINSAGSLDQRPVYKLDNDSYFESYITETKPYRTKIRTYTSKYDNNNNIEDAGVFVTDFDLPPYLNSITNSVSTVNLGDSVLSQQPWKSWFDNYKYQISEILVGDGGTRYTQVPVVEITTAHGDTGSGAIAEAQIKNGKLYKINIINAGNGYTIPPTVTIIGGGPYVTKVARANAVLGNNPIRKNKIGIRFDRVGAESEIGSKTVTETFVCSRGSRYIDLGWLASDDKTAIVPTLDGKLIYATDYTLETYSDGQDSKGYNQKKTRFVFLNAVPLDGQIFKISYQKHINLYTAVDRINNLYKPTDVMPGAELPLLMSGTDYPRTQLQGLNFNYSSPFSENNRRWQNTVWEDQIDYYTSSELVKSIEIMDRTLTLASVTGIIPGQIVNILNSSVKRVRDGTLVESVNNSANTIVISAPSYRIKKVRADSTASGSTITVWTSVNFNDNIKIGDIAEIYNIDRSEISGFNGRYVIEDVLDNDKFIVSAVNELTTTTVGVYSTESNVTISSILEPIDVFENRTLVEFWRYDHNQAGLDTALSAGTWDQQGNLLGALGIAPEDLIIDGDEFLSPNASYAPEECLPGEVVESLGINVYTKSEESYPIAISNVVPIGEIDVVTRYQVGMSLDDVAGIIVHFDRTGIDTESEIFNRVQRDFDFTQNNQYFLDGDVLVIAPQQSTGRLSYTIVTSGGEKELDSNAISIKDQSTATVSSSASASDVRKVYVLMDTVEVPELVGDPGETVEFGYVLSSISENGSRRACVTLYNIPQGTHTIAAWFYKVQYAKFNTVSEEVISVSAPENEFTLLKVPRTRQPLSAQVIVEVGIPGIPTARKRLSPPWVSYYQISNNQRTFDIDTKNNRPGGTYTYSNIKVYVNGIELTQIFEYTVDSQDGTVDLATFRFKDGDEVAIVSFIDYDYDIIDNKLMLTSGVSNTTIKVTTFSTHDNMLMRTERFKFNGLSRFILSRPTVNDNFVWVYVNGLPLTARYDYEILDDKRTILISDYLLSTDDSVVITTISPPYVGDRILGYRVFTDSLGRTHYKRIAQYHSTTLAKELSIHDTEIHVVDSTRIITPNAAQNKPGIIIIDGERIEFFIKAGNILRQLRRGTLGTSPALYSEIGTTVIDQSAQQTIPYSDSVAIQTTATTESVTYSIDTGTITLSQIVNAEDQVSVYYGGRLLRKSNLEIHDFSKSFNTTESSTIELPPEFSIDALSNQLTLNIVGGITPGIDLSIMQKTGSVWTGTESLITSDVIQAQFLRDKEAVLPDIYYYGGDATLLEESYIPLTNENDEPLEGY